MEEVIVISAQEKRQDFLYVLILFIIAATLLIWIILINNDNYLSITSKEKAELPQGDSKFKEAQRSMIPVFDSALANIIRSQATYNNLSLNTDISIDINKIRLYARATQDDSTGIYYQSFSRMETFLIRYQEESQKRAILRINIKKLEDKLGNNQY